MGWGFLLQRLKTAGLLLALFALTFKALLPPGYMLTPEQNRIAVTLCTINGAFDMVMPSNGGAPDEHGGEHDDRGAAPCVFAAVGAINVPSPAPAPAGPAVVAAAPDWPPVLTRPSYDLAAPPPWPTGPPLSI